MTTDQIESLFYSLLEEKAIYNELTGISEDKIYNWRKGRGAKPTIGDMLNVLYQLKKIMIKKASPGEVDFMNEIEEAWDKWPSKETLLEKGKLDNLTSTSRAERMLFGSSKLPGDLNTEESIIWAQPTYESLDKFSKANPDSEKKESKALRANWKSAKIEEPNFDNVNYMVILQLNDGFFYGSAYWDGKIWLYETVKNSHVVAFTEVNPKFVIDSLARM